MLYRNLEEESSGHTVGGDETNAEWGETEKHVLLWSLTGADPYIAIYEIERLVGSFDGPQAIAKLSLNPGLLEVEARMLEGPLADGPEDVFIFEVDQSRRKRILLLGAKDNPVTTEINMSLLTKRPTTIGDQEQPPAQDTT